MTSHGMYEELVAGYALDALEPDDCAVLLRHLPTCAGCTRLLDEFRRTAGELAYASADEDPPAQVWEAIRAQLNAPEPDTSVLPRQRAKSTRTLELAGGGGAAPVAALRPHWLRRPHPAMSSVAAGVVGVAVLAGGGYLWHVHGQESAQRSALAEYRTMVSDLAFPGSNVIALTGSGAARGTAVIDRSKVDVVLDGVTPNDPADSIYVLWAIHPNGSVEAVEKFDVNSPDVTIERATLASDELDAVGFAISHENGLTIPASPSAPVLSSV